MEPKESCWVLGLLWTPGSMFYTKVRLLDTLLNDSRSPTGLRWLFTDHNGEVKKHSQQNARIEMIVKTFVAKALESSNLSGYSKATVTVQKTAERPGESELLTATLITDSDFRALNRQQAVSVINQRGLGNNCALQQFIYPCKELHIRYRVLYRALDGRFVYSFSRVNIAQDSQPPEAVRAGEMCRKMQEVEKEVRTVIERNTGQRVMELELLFVLDHERSLWLCGSTKCHIAAPEMFKTMFHVEHPIVKASSQQSLLTHRLQSTQSIGSFRESVYLPTQASIAHTYRTFPSHPNPHTERCAGDFCNFVLSELKSLQRGEVDYDDLIKVIRTAYSSDGQQEALNIKLAIAVDYLSKERSKLKPKSVIYNIPNRYLILGRKLMKRSRWKENWEVGDQLEIDLTPLIQLGGRLYLLQDEISEIEKGGQSQPFFYYNTVKVCGRCYPIYLMIRKAHINALAASANPSVTPPPLSVSKLSRATTSYLTRRASVRSMEMETIVTSLGKINKNNLNDLLVDMRFAQQEEAQDSQRVRNELSHMYRNMTEGERKKKEDEKKKEAQERANVIEPKKVEGHSLEQDLTLRFFPAENTKSLRVFDEKSRNLAKWRQFMDKRKHVRPKTSS